MHTTSNNWQNPPSRYLCTKSCRSSRTRVGSQWWVGLDWTCHWCLWKNASLVWRRWLTFTRWCCLRFVADLQSWGGIQNVRATRDAAAAAISIEGEKSCFKIVNLSFNLSQLVLHLHFHAWHALYFFFVFFFFSSTACARRRPFSFFGVRMADRPKFL